MQLEIVVREMLAVLAIFPKVDLKQRQAGPPKGPACPWFLAV
jgi:hypothetical protein